MGFDGFACGLEIPDGAWIAHLCIVFDSGLWNFLGASLDCAFRFIGTALDTVPMRETASCIANEIAHTGVNLKEWGGMGVRGSYRFPGVLSRAVMALRTPDLRLPHCKTFGS